MKCISSENGEFCKVCYTPNEHAGPECSECNCDHDCRWDREKHDLTCKHYDGCTYIGINVGALYLPWEYVPEDTRTIYGTLIDPDQPSRGRAIIAQGVHPDYALAIVEAMNEYND